MPCACLKKKTKRNHWSGVEAGGSPSLEALDPPGTDLGSTLNPPRAGDVPRRALKFYRVGRGVAVSCPAAAPRRLRFSGRRRRCSRRRWRRPASATGDRTTDATRRWWSERMCSAAPSAAAQGASITEPRTCRDWSYRTQQAGSSTNLSQVIAYATDYSSFFSFEQRQITTASEEDPTSKTNEEAM
jgi:hypothetical protein